MLNRKRLMACFAGVCVLFAGAVSAGTSRVDGWPAYSVDALSYMTSHLPHPLVLYVYTSDATLLSIVDPHGHGDSTSVSKVAGAIAARHFPTLHDAKRRAMAQSLKYLLADAGYNIGDVVSHGSQYTLVVAINKVKPSDCPSFASMQSHFLNAIHKAVASDAGGKGEYSVAVLQLESAKLHIRCAK